MFQVNSDETKPCESFEEYLEACRRRHDEWEDLRLEVLGCEANLAHAKARMARHEFQAGVFHRANAKHNRIAANTPAQPSDDSGLGSEIVAAEDEAPVETETEQALSEMIASTADEYADPIDYTAAANAVRDEHDALFAQPSNPSPEEPQPEAEQSPAQPTNIWG